jgi:hypothetical protein
MPWELRKKRLLGEPPLPKLTRHLKIPKLHKLPKVPKALRPPKPEAPPGHEYYWRDE